MRSLMVLGLMLAAATATSSTAYCPQRLVPLIADAKEALAQGRRFEASVKATVGLSLFPGCEETKTLRLIRARSLWLLEDRVGAHALLQNQTDDRSRLHDAWLYHLEGDNQFLLRLGNQTERGQRVVHYLDAAAQDQGYPKISVFGVTVAGLVPGGGYASLGLWESALLSVLLAGGLSVASYELFDARLEAPGAAAGFAASFFYVGSILGGAKAAADENRRRQRRFLRAQQRKWLPELNL